MKPLHPEELYGDAIPLIEKTIAALEEYPESNATIEGRVKGELKYLRQQILKRDLRIPKVAIGKLKPFPTWFANSRLVRINPSTTILARSTRFCLLDGLS